MECSLCYENKHTSPEERREKDRVLNLVFGTLARSASDLLEAYSERIRMLEEELARSGADKREAR